MAWPKLKAALAMGCCLVALAGCANEQRFYPLCVFGPDPLVSSQAALEASLLEFVQLTGGSYADIAISPNGRVVSVVAPATAQASLAVGWPRAACVGQTRTPAEFAMFRACVEMIEAALANNGVPPLGESSDALGQGLLFCGRRPGRS